MHCCCINGNTYPQCIAAVSMAIPTHNALLLYPWRYLPTMYCCCINGDTYTQCIAAVSVAIPTHNVLLLYQWRYLPTMHRNVDCAPNTQDVVLCVAVRGRPDLLPESTPPPESDTDSAGRASSYSGFTRSRTAESTPTASRAMPA
jgi:hypothetical protein